MKFPFTEMGRLKEQICVCQTGKGSGAQKFSLEMRCLVDNLVKMERKCLDIKSGVQERSPVYRCTFESQEEIHKIE